MIIRQPTLTFSLAFPFLVLRRRGGAALFFFAGLHGSRPAICCGVAAEGPVGEDIVDYSFCSDRGFVVVVVVGIGSVAIAAAEGVDGGGEEGGGDF